MAGSLHCLLCFLQYNVLCSTSVSWFCEYKAFVSLYKVIHTKKDRPDCNNYRGISVVAHAGKVLLKIVVSRLSKYCEVGEYSVRNSVALVQQDQQSTCCSSCDGCKNSDEREKSPYTRASLTCRKRTTLSTETCCGRYVRTRFGVPAMMLTVIREFHDGMRACVRTDDGEHSEWFDVAQGLRQGCVLSLLLFKRVLWLL